MPKLLRFDLRDKDEKSLFDKMFIEYLKEVCDPDEFCEELDDLHNDELDRQMVEQTLREHNPYFVMKILHEEKCVGFVTYIYRETERIGFINNFYIYPQYRNKGLGTSVYLLVEERLKTSGATYIELNPIENAKRFYARHGFSPSRTAPNGEIIYRKTLG